MDFESDAVPTNDPAQQSREGVDQSSEAVLRPGFAAPLLLPAQWSCWRCQKHVSLIFAECPYCAAPFLHDSAAAAGRPAAPAVLPLVRSFSILLVLLVLFAIANSLTHDQPEAGRAATRITTSDVVIDGLWTLAVLIAVWIMPRPAPLPPRRPTVRITAWSLALPALAAAIWVNVTYHSAILNYAGSPMKEPTPEQPDGLTLAGLILMICVQPGVIEELFFRYLALGTLRGIMGDHAAVIVSGLMFGFAHLGAPFSIPVLACIGFMLGYIRLYSGSLLLVMLLHALHNGYVIWSEFTGHG